MAEMRDIFFTTLFVVIVAVLFLYASIIGFGASTLTFLVIGDFGGLPSFPYSTAIERAVAKQMSRYADDTYVDFVLTLGDNFYYDGVNNVNDRRFIDTYEHVFEYSSLDKPWYLLAGNHDYRGNVSAQIAYSDINYNWNFPDYYYVVKYEIPYSTKSLEIIMIDTVMLCGVSDDFNISPLKGPENNVLANEQWTWIEQKIKASTAEYLIVAGHYPVLSIAEHGNTELLYEYLSPLLEKYNVSAYFSGHEHNIQHLQSDFYGPMNYFISGCSNFIDTSTSHHADVPKEQLKFHWAKQMSLGGFGSVKLTDKEMKVTFYESLRGGEEIYSYTIKPRDVRAITARIDN